MKILEKWSSIIGLDLTYFIGGGFWLASSTILTFIGGLLLSALFARIWPKETYGQFSFLMSLVGIASVLALPGMSQAVTQASSEGKDGVFKKACKIVSLWSLVGAVFLIIIAYYFYLKGSINLAIAILLSAILFPVISGASLYNSFLAGKKLFKKVAIFGSIAQLVSILATAIALFYWPSLIAVSFFSACSTAIVNFILTLLAFREVKNKVSDENTLKMGVHLSFSQFFTISADYIDKLLIPLFLGFANNAIYAFAILIPMQIHGFLKVFTTLGQPKVAALSSKNLKRSLVVKSLQLEALIATITLFYIIVAPEIFRILYPGYTGEAIALSQIFSLSLLYFPGNILAFLFLKERQTKPVYQINVFYALATVCSLVVLVPIFGLSGAIMAKVIVRFLQLGIQIYIFKDYSVKI